MRIVDNINSDTIFKKNDVSNLNNTEEIEKEIEEEAVKLMEKPFDPTKINIETKTQSLDTLISRIERGYIEMNTATYFQRKDDLWDTVKQSRLIESILIQFPLPAFFFDATDDKKWLVVDGLQRLSSIRNFVLKKTLKLTGLEFLESLNKINAGWNDIGEDLQRNIKETQVVIYKILPGTPTDVKFNIFKRINTGGLTLEPQEIRHALFQGTPAKLLAELAKTDEFLDATESKIAVDRMLDRDFVNRFLCFYLLGYENYQPDLDTYMSKALAVINSKTLDEIEKIRHDFKQSMILAKEVFGNEAFRKVYEDYERRPPINKALFDAISTQFALLSDEERAILKERRAQMREDLRELLNPSGAFFTAVTSSTGDKGKIMERHGSLKKIIFKIIN